MADQALLLDGWQLCAAPNGPAALHLLTLLQAPLHGKTLHLALPAEPPGWLVMGSGETILQKTRLSPGARLGWVHNTLPGLRRKLQAERLVMCGEEAPLTDQAHTAAFPAGFNLVRPPETSGAYRSLAERLGASLGWAGLSHAGAVLWPADLPAPDNLPGQRKIPPFVHPDFHPQEGVEADVRKALPDLPETYVLYHGPASGAALNVLFDAWRWAADSLGQSHPLVLAGLVEAELDELYNRLKKRDLEDSVRGLPVLPPQQLAGLYRQCTAFFHPAACSPWGDPLRHALACGRPAVAAQVPLADRLTGPAAYLASYIDARALSAALISVVVDESLAEKLSQAALGRSAAWLGNTAKSVMEGI